MSADRPAPSGQSPAILCAGEAVIDMIPEGDIYRPVTGGAAYNTACAAARLGASAGFLGGISRDRLGERLMHIAVSEGVGMNCCVRTDLPTPISIVDLSGEHPAYAIHDKETAGDAITPRTLPDPGSPAALLVGGFSLIRPPAADAFELLAERISKQTCLYLDLNIRPALISDPDAYRERLRRLLKRASVVKASDEDLEWLQDDLSKVAPQALLLHTRGKAGASARIGEFNVYVPAPETDICDTVGAGDVFNAAWLAIGLSGGQFVPRTENSLKSALTFAVSAASISTTRSGADGPTLQEMSCAP